MSDQLILPELWNEVLRRHWSFLETEESIQKLEQRKKLEGCLKEFLCIVPHDRKFFLPETAHVLKKSVREMEDFTAHKAMIGFEAISQYANNLFTQPWRPEFRTLRTYCGYYQHEVKSNLLDTDKLLEAMGYQYSGDAIYTLEGPICPDQVTNVSRDALAAYVECQIMRGINAGLAAAGLTCTWQEIFSYRERFVGGVSQAITDLAYTIQDRQLRQEAKLKTADSLDSQKRACCPPAVKPALELAGYGVHKRGADSYTEPVPSCSHAQAGVGGSSKTRMCQQPHVYESPYDYIDDGSLNSSASYAAVAASCTGNYSNAFEHPYNEPGNRYPLPFNISNQFQPLCDPCEGYAQIAGLSKQCQCLQCHGPMTAATACGSCRTSKPHKHPRQHSFPTDQLIDFNEQCAHDKRNNKTSSLDYDYGYSCANCAPTDARNLYARPRDDIGFDFPPIRHKNDGHIYAQPIPKSNRPGGQKLLTAKNNSEEQYYEKQRKSRKELRKAVNTNEASATFGRRSPTQTSKDQDGVGSFESWNYVFQNLERSGYTKDLGKRDDLLVQSLDLDALTLSNGSKLRANEKPATSKPQNREQKSQQQQQSPTPPQQQQPQQRQESQQPNNTKKIKSALKTRTSSLNDREASAQRTPTSSNGKHPPPVSTQVIVTSPNEWSCRFCTFLNPNSKRICEMCCRSKDFNPEASSNNSRAPTCA